MTLDGENTGRQLKPPEGGPAQENRSTTMSMIRYPGRTADLELFELPARYGYPWRFSFVGPRLFPNYELTAIANNSRTDRRSYSGLGMHVAC